MPVDNFVDTPCEDELSPRQGLSSVGHLFVIQTANTLCFNDLNKKIKPSEGASAGEPHELRRCATLCISQADRPLSGALGHFCKVSADSAVDRPTASGGGSPRAPRRPGLQPRRPV